MLNSIRVRSYVARRHAHRQLHLTYHWHFSCILLCVNIKFFVIFIIIINKKILILFYLFIIIIKINYKK